MNAMTLLTLLRRSSGGRTILAITNAGGKAKLTVAANLGNGAPADDSYITITGDTVSGYNTVHQVQSTSGATITTTSSYTSDGTGGSWTRTTPATVSDLVAAAGNAEVDLTWTDPAHITSVNVYQATAPGGPYTLAGSAALGDEAATVTGLDNDTTYYFVVKGVNDTVEGAASNEEDATPTATVTPADFTNYLGFWGAGQKFTDVGGTTPAVATNDVKAWRDALDPAGGGMLTTSATGVTLNADGSLQFGGATQLTLPSGLWAATKTIVFLIDPAPTGSYGQFFGGSDKTNLICLVAAGGGGLATLDAAASFITFTSTRMISGIQAYAIVLSTTADRVYRLGDESGIQFGLQGASALITRADPACLGENSGANFPWGGKCLAFACYSDEKSRADIGAITLAMNRQLTTASGLAGNLLMHGNSLTSGDMNNPGERYLDYLAALLPTANVVNIGTSGIQTPDLTTGFSPVGGVSDQWLPRRKNIAVMWEVRNHVEVGGATRQQAYDALVAYHQAVQDRGVFDKTIATTVAHNMASNTDRLWINDQIRTNFADFCDGYIDIGAATHIGVGSSVSDPTYWNVDTVHLSALGNQEAAGVAATDLAALI